MRMMMMMVKNKKVSGGSEVDIDQESVGGSSSEEMEYSPRSVLLIPAKTKIGRNNIHRWKSSNSYGNLTGKMVGVERLYLHRQIMRIRDEDAHIGEDINAELLLNFCVTGNDEQVLPGSPLNTKKTTASAIKAAD